MFWLKKNENSVKIKKMKTFCTFYIKNSIKLFSNLDLSCKTQQICYLVGRVYSSGFSPNWNHTKDTKNVT